AATRTCNKDIALSAPRADHERNTRHNIIKKKFCIRRTAPCKSAVAAETKVPGLVKYSLGTLSSPSSNAGIVPQILFDNWWKKSTVCPILHTIHIHMQNLYRYAILSSIYIQYTYIQPYNCNLSEQAKAPAITDAQIKRAEVAASNISKANTTLESLSKLAKEIPTIGERVVSDLVSNTVDKARESSEEAGQSLRSIIQVAKTERQNSSRLVNEANLKNDEAERNLGGALVREEFAKRKDADLLERERAGRDLESTLHQRELQVVKSEERMAVLRETMEERQRQAEEAIRHAGVLSDETSALTRVAEGFRKAAEELEGR
ncbi:MAG: hypothetical protein Q9164_007634, partial [Protoblastenia rupestris]